jgi:hypothetical protein
MSVILDRSKTYYLAGPMTGYPKFNFPRFHEVAKTLRSQGVNIINPAELDFENVKLTAYNSETGELDSDGKVAGHTWGDFLSRDVKVIADQCSGLIAMDDWSGSKGARLEVFVALQLKYPVYWYRSYNMVGPENEVDLLPPRHALELLMLGMTSDGL